ncbi:MAG: cation diffusion facilitator family transporter [Clostridia bacterium]|nr:cation diffusion facilitator family transporter [Clostridia bacterium]
MTSLLIKLFVKNSNNTKDNAVRTAYGNLGSAVGICANIILSVSKILIGFLGGMLSITADGLNNLADMGSSVLTLIGFKLSSKPADRDHPFGHGRMEYMSAFTVSFLILLVGFELLGDSVGTLVDGAPAPTFTTLSIIVLILSIAIKCWLYFFNRKVGKIIDSSALIATAKDSLNDCISTGAILVVSIVTRFVDVPFNLDAVVAIGVAFFIIWSGISSAKDTLNEILGAPPEKELIDNISDIVLSFEYFVGIHDLIVHNYGPGRQFASVHVEVPQNENVVLVHEKVDLCEKLIYEKLGVNLVIHMDPIDTDNQSIAVAREKMSAAIKTIDERLTLHDFRMTPAAHTRTNLIFDVVVPAKFNYTEKELDEIINTKARELDKTYVCVITFDNDFTGEQIH